MTTTPPRWDLSNVYSGLNAPELQNDMQWVTDETKAVEKFFQEKVAILTDQADPKTVAAGLSTLIDKINTLLLKASTIGVYFHSFISTDSYNKEAMRMNSKFEIILVQVQITTMKIQAWLGKVRKLLPQVLDLQGSARDHSFFVLETAKQAQYLMSEPEEILASELSLSGGDAWTQLQGTVTSQKTAEIELDGELKTLPMPAVINLHGHPDEAVRKRAYELEMKSWEEIKEPIAAAMNGVKGTVNTLNHHRNREDALHSALDMTRIDRQTLDAMMGAMKDSFPMFRKYFKAKARRFGQEALPWWNLYAPVGKVEKTFDFTEAKALILEKFATFSPELSDFAAKAF
ncbi:MAG: hypothetical protein MUO40_12175, partial [Anaerolineaceae bacterium]|nr:hypothetical protein [Anaerolineaceae bacterium]